jgi:hypothetical protein
MHSEKALAYDVAIGMCHIRTHDLHELRKAADWRLLKGLDDGNPAKIFLEYFDSGKFNDASVDKWANTPESEGSMPNKIVDQREHPAPKAPARWGGHP